MPRTAGPTPPDGLASEDEVELHIVFDYLIQRTPTRTKRRVQTRKDNFNVHLRLSRGLLDDRGYPAARALWHAERMFLQGFNKKHLPDVRLLSWTSRLKDDPFILSEYEVLLPRTLD